MESYDIFISYRRNEPGIGRNLELILTHTEYNFRVFFDSSDLQNTGVGLWTELLEEAIMKSQVFIVAMGTQWAGKDNLKRLFNEDDPVRNEIITANKHNLTIVPVLFDGNQMPKAGELPPELSFICSQHAHDMPNTEFHNAKVKLINKILTIVGPFKNKELLPLPAEVASEAWAEMINVIKSPEYRAWQDDYLYRIYKSQKQKTENNNNGPIFFPTVAGTRYALVCYFASLGDSKFEHTQLSTSQPIMRSPRELTDLNILDSVIPEWVSNGEFGLLRTKYFEILSYTRLVKRWNMRGFSLERLILNSQKEVLGYKANLCTYGENCLTSHILAYEIYKEYINKNSDFDFIKTLRPEIKLFNNGDQQLNDVLTINAADDFFPLISVQALVVYRTVKENNNWQLLVMERSSKCAAVPGFWQFPPAGGFEIYGTEDEDDFHIKQQFDMRLAVIREFLEEIYGDADMTCDDQNASKAAHEGSFGFQQVMKSIENGTMNIHFLGVVTELISLRSEFSFLIVIDDPDIIGMRYQVNLPDGKQRFAQWMCGNEESKRIYSIKFNDVTDLLCQPYLWNPSSIGLLIIFANLLNKDNGWLSNTYPTMPKILLPIS